MKNAVPPAPPTSAWNLFVPRPGVWYRWRLDGAEVHLWNRGDEWRLIDKPRSLGTHRRNFGGPEERASAAEEYQSCFAASQPVALRPTTLNRPLIVQNSTAVTVHRDQEAVFAVDLPISVRFVLASGMVLSTLQTILLTKTWFGDSTTGIPCFLWPVRLRAAMQDAYGSLVRCRIRVRNETKSPIFLKQFVIDSELLSLWARGDALITNEILLEVQADGSLRMAVLPPAENDPGGILYEAPVGQTERQIQRGVEFLRTIAGIT